MDDLDLFATWLKRRRKALDLTREALAGRAHCSTSTIRRLEADDLRVSVQLAESLAAALNVPIDLRADFVRFVRGDASFAARFTLQAEPSPAVHRRLSVISNLPAPLTSVVGRQREIKAIRNLLSEPGVRLLTLTGPPGTGKTRLSVAVAQQLLETKSTFADGIFFVPLAPLADAQLVVSALAQVLGVREGQAAGLLDPLHHFLRDKRVLIVLDNFEQVIDAAPLVTDLLSHAPRVKIIVTSREVLHVYGEHEFPVPALSLPDVKHLPTAKALSYFRRFASLKLFKDRARAVKADFQLTLDNVADVARICARLDGLPLAIELAAAQVKWLPIPRLLDQLSDQLAALTDGPIDLALRPQSLSGAIEWSYRLLDDHERNLFNALGVFVGGCDEEAIADCGLWLADLTISHLQSTLRNLIEKSLLRYEAAADGGARYMMLESIREYAFEKLRLSGELDQARAAHAVYFCRLADAAATYLERGHAQAAWLDRLEMDHNNFRAALAWATEDVAARDDARCDTALTLAAALTPFWELRGYLSEGQRWLDAALSLDAAQRLGRARTPLRARVLNCAGFLARRRGQIAQAKILSEEALSIGEEQGDKVSQAVSLLYLGILAYVEVDRTRATPAQIIDATCYAPAHDLMERSLTLAYHLDQPALLSQALGNLAIVARRQSDFTRAEALLKQSLEIDRSTNNYIGLVRTLQGLGNLALDHFDFTAAIKFFQESLVYRQRTGDRTGFATGFNALATALYQCGRELDAARCLGMEQTLREATGVVSNMRNRTNWQRELAAARERVGADEFDAAFAEGKVLSLEAAIAFAMSLDVGGEPRHSRMEIQRD